MQAWDGRVKLDKGEVLDVEGYRFREGDEVSGRDGWKAKSHVIRKVAAKKAAMPPSAVPVVKAGGAKHRRGGDRAQRRGRLAQGPGRRDADGFATARAMSRSALADLDGGASERYLDGKVEAQRVPPSVPAGDGARTRKTSPPPRPIRRGGAWVAYVVHKPLGRRGARGVHRTPQGLRRPRSQDGGGDQIRLLRFADGKAGDPLDVTAERARRLAARGRRRWRRRGRRRLVREQATATGTSTAGPIDPRHEDVVGAEAARRPARGPIPMSSWRRPPTARSGWPGRAGSNGQADILLAPVEDAGTPIRVSEAPGQRVVAGARHRQGGAGPRRLRQLSGGQLRRHAPHPRPRRHARPARSAVAGTPEVRGPAEPWRSTREGGSGSPTRSGPTNWGKDAENLVDGEGSSLYRGSSVRVRCVDGDRVLDAPDPVAEAGGPSRIMNSFPRLAVDRSGRIWLAYRHRQEAIWGNQAVMVVGGVWIEYVTTLAGQDVERPPGPGRGATACSTTARRWSSPATGRS